MEKYFDIIHFFRRSNVSLCLCHVFFRVSFCRGWVMRLYYDSLIGVTICWPLGVAVNSCFFACLVPSGEVIVTWLYRTCLIIILNCGARCINSHSCLSSAFLSIMLSVLFVTEKYLKQWQVETHVCSPWVTSWLSGVVFIYVYIIFGFSLIVLY